MRQKPKKIFISGEEMSIQIAKAFPHRVPTGHDFNVEEDTPDILIWCRKIFKTEMFKVTASDWYWRHPDAVWDFLYTDDNASGFTFFFKEEKDALHFKLVWG